MAGEKDTGASDSFIGWFMIGCVVAAILYVIWLYQEEAIKDAYRWFRVSELWVASLFTSDDTLVYWGADEVPFGTVFDAAINASPSQLTGPFLGRLSDIALAPFRWIFVAIMALMTIWLYFKGPESENRTKFGLEGLMKRQSKVFPVISPFVRFNPGTLAPRPPGAPVPADIPQFAEALGPEEWIAYNGIPIPDGQLDETATNRAFAKQLGPRWKGAMNLAPYKQILLAACCLKTVRKRNEADDMLARLAVCWSHDKGLKLSKDRKLLGDARRILRNKKLAGSTLSKCNQHAWQTTALLGALFQARSEGGVMAPAQFVWLRGFDRALWYPLNNLGRHSYHMEALGAISHYKAEKRVSRPIPKPKVQDAVQAISEYMNSDIARPVPQVDYSGSKKRGIKKMKTA